MIFSSVLLQGGASSSMIFRRVTYFFKMIWLFTRHSFVKGKPEFWSWCFELSREKEGSWFNDNNLVFFLLDSAIRYENDYRLCALYRNFKSSFQEELFFKKHINQMQKACRKEHAPDTFSSEHGRIDWNNINQFNKREE